MDNRWYLIAEDKYCAFCNSLDLHEKMDIVLSASCVNKTFQASQLKILNELFYRALSYCCEEALDYSSTSLLLLALERELVYLTTWEQDNSDSLVRFQNTVSCKFKTDIHC